VGGSYDFGGEMGEGEDDDVVAVIPRYAMPNISSILPEYANCEQDVIRRAFANANYDALHNLPSTLDYGEVNKHRRAHMEQARKMLIENMPHPAGSIAKPTNKNGLFQEFEYQPSPYELYDEFEHKERVVSDAKRMEVSGRDFNTGGVVHKATYEDGFTDGVRYPHSVNPYEAAQDQMLRQKWLEESKILSGPFIPADGSSTLHQTEHGPTKAMARDVIQQVQKIVCEDWEDVEVAIYINEDEQWVIRFPLEGIDSDAGLVAYMNVFVRTNKIIEKYKLVKVVEHWNVRPGDGHVYFTLRPPWVKVRPVEGFYVLHPEERLFRGAERAA